MKFVNLLCFGLMIAGSSLVGIENAQAGLMGIGRPQPTVICSHGNGWATPPTIQQEEEYLACLENNDGEDWRVYQHYCVDVDAQDYDAAACREALRNLDEDDYCYDLVCGTNQGGSYGGGSEEDSDNSTEEEGIETADPSENSEDEQGTSSTPPRVDSMEPSGNEYGACYVTEIFEGLELITTYCTETSYVDCQLHSGDPTDFWGTTVDFEPWVPCD